MTSMTSQFQHEMRPVSLINDAQIVERILRHVGLWVDEVCNHGVRISPSTGPPATETIECGQLVIEPWLDDPMPDDDCGLGLRIRSALERTAAVVTHAI